MALSKYFVNKTRLKGGFYVERNTGIEPAPSPWQGDVLPLY
ncbi:MAG: hypothetical protein US36_C0012G0002 [Candidatus Wolfebacteria bacterium GW2011_GWC1_37_10]|uniref:Uncharacterized protein n=1 Tax=Candidatus Wolfebacteria bacterium GW2011_GWC1_37_10 TaxID=1619010 RepID=A0A0G0FS26_9BACT|nr:MAG: hypothetical protein US36_C0012G0002 [Candidatus Wolfebacteria bacterium GW2011_GWC1_37_10]